MSAPSDLSSAVTAVVLGILMPAAIWFAVRRTRARGGGSRADQGARPDLDAFDFPPPGDHPGGHHPGDAHLHGDAGGDHGGHH